MLHLDKDPLSASAVRPICLDEAACIRQILRFGFPIHAALPLSDRPGLQKVLVERIHFSARRPMQIQLSLHGHSGWAQSLIAEWVGEDAEAYALREKLRLRKSRRKQLSTSNEGILACPDWGLVLRRPGLDAKLPGLRLLHHPRLTAELLQLLEGRPTGQVEVKLVAHRLGKRAVLRVSSALTGTRYIRLRAISSLSGQRCFKLHQALYDSLVKQVEVAIPAPVGFDIDLGAAVFKRLPGEPANWVSKHGIFTSETISRAIRRLQSVQDLALAHHTAEQENAILSNLYRRIQVVFPALAEQLAKPLEHTTSLLMVGSGQPPVITHRDLHQGQILFSAGKPGLLDFDTASLAEPVVDVANLQAHLYFSALRNQCNSDAMEQALLRYLPALPVRQLGCWRAAALLRLAMIYAFSHEPRKVIHQLIREAATCCSR